MARSKSEKWLSRLVALVPPPAKPVDSGSLSRRKSVEKTIGTALPDDFCELASVYGSGEFRTDRYSNVMAIENPFSHWFTKSLQKTSKMFAGSWSGYQMYPESPGLLMCGNGEGPRALFYLTEGAPNDWPLLVYYSLSPLTPIKATITEYLFRLIDASLEGEWGRLENRWFKKLKGKFWFEQYHD
jgi:hypothetical protein